MNSLESLSNEVRLEPVSQARASRLAQGPQGADKIALVVADGGDKLASAVADGRQKIASVIAAADVFQGGAARLW